MLSRKPFDPAALFANGSTVATPTIHELMEWRESTGTGRLLLPPIQRSLVWRNAQIVNYWDSLLRGYPPGLFMVHRAGDAKDSAGEVGTDETGAPQKANAGDWQLFDGQQRVSALLLGRGEGQLKNHLRLWVDLGRAAKGDLRFALRMSSLGQPFGYEHDDPNSKFALGQRADWLERWPKETTREERFRGDGPERPWASHKDEDPGYLLGSQCPVPLRHAIDLVEHGRGHELMDFGNVDHEIADQLVTALTSALTTQTIVKRVSSDIVREPDNYIRFFGRLGQGGTPLSNDELSYSLIKHRFPHVRERMSDVMGDTKAGRLAGTTDLVLAAMRVARVMRRHETREGGTGRPNPKFISGISEPDPILAPFDILLPEEKPSSREQGDHLQALVIRLRAALELDPDCNVYGLPSVLLARMPKQLLDMLLLFTMFTRDGGWTDEDQRALCAFTLHFLLFVTDAKKAANATFGHVGDAVREGIETGSGARWAFTTETARALIDLYESEQLAFPVPREGDIPALFKQAEASTHVLRSVAERFTKADRTPSETKTRPHQPGAGLRYLATHRGPTRNALLWLQRDYIHKSFSGYDPTSARDEDMPLDLDHIIPNSLFGFNWGGNVAKRALAQPDENRNFYRERHQIGNSLGNFRWLCGRINRSRKDGKIKPDGNNENRFDLIKDVDDWNKLIPEKKKYQEWSLDDIASFQRLIETRTVQLYKMILKDGIGPVLPPLPHAEG